MRLINIILFCLLSLSVYPATYYVAPTGSDSDPGTFEEPWATLQQAINTAIAGDTVYFRGGVYYMSEGAIIDPTYLYWQDRFGHDGTAENPICFFNYPGETPIFDGTVAQDRDGYLTAIGIECAHFLKFRGFEIRNFLQRGNHWWVGGITCQLCSNLSFENIKIHDMGGRAFFYLTACGDRRGYDYLPADYPEPVTFWRYWNEEYPIYIPYDSTYYINCDAYNCADSVAEVEGGTPYNMADGFKLAQTSVGYLYLEGCRAWNVSDDGFDINGSCLGVFKNCWSFENGVNYPGALDGNGFKYGFVDAYDYSDISSSNITRILKNNLAALNYNYGFADLKLARAAMSIHNNTAYKNGWGFTQGVQEAVGAARENWYRNNVSFNNTINSMMEEGTHESNNTWKYCESCMNWSEENISVTNADFVSLDSSQLKLPRKADGSLPDITFLTLSPTSNLVDAGINVGLSYNGSAPDIGYAEYGGVDSSMHDILTFTLSEQTGSATINTTNHTVSIEVEYGTSVTALQPTITLSYGATVSPTSGTATNFTNPVTYTVTALDESTQEWVVTVSVESTPNATPVVTNIPNQTITTGSLFATINLDNYVSDADNTDSQITWTYSGDTHINISITNRVATITYDNGFTGSETITFTATDPDDLSDSDQAVFTVNAASTPSGTCLLRINYAGSKKVRQGSDRRIRIN